MRTHQITRVVQSRVRHQWRQTAHGWAQVPVSEPERREIERELPVCGSCHRLLVSGLTLSQVRRLRVEETVSREAMKAVSVASVAKTTSHKASDESEAEPLAPPQERALDASFASTQPEPEKPRPSRRRSRGNGKAAGRKSEGE